MILSICVSPCIDVNIEVDSLANGMQHQIISKRTFLTGKAINVAIGVSRLGNKSYSTGFMYEDNGKLFEQQFDKENVEYKFVWNEGRVRENYKFIDDKSMLTEFNDVSASVCQQNQQKLIDLVAEISKRSNVVAMSGGLAKGMSPEYYGKVLSVVPKNVIKVVDTEGERLLSALKCGVDLAKPNEDELQRTLKTRFTSRADQLKGCYKLLDMGAKAVLLSLGKHGAIITDGTKNYYAKSNNVAMNSTVGAGDAMVAGACVALENGAPLIDVLRCGVAAGTAAVTQPGAISFTKDKYDEILSKLTVSEI